jgi:sugar transferase (PEP-CTERM system associated)
MIRIFSQYVSLKSLLLMVLESCLIVLSLVCAVKLRFWNNPTEYSLYVAFPDFAGQIAIVVAVCLACFYFNDLYDLRTGYGPVERVLRVEQSLGAACLLLGLLYFLFPNLLLSRGVFLIGMLLVTTFVLLARKLLDRAWQLSTALQRVIILGTGQLALELAREITCRDDLGMRLEGFLSAAHAGPDGEKVFGFPVLGPVAAIEGIARDLGIARIIVALEDRRGVLPTRELVSLRVQGLRVDDAPTALAGLTGRISLRSVKPSWFVFSEGFHRSKWNDLLKRILDLTVGMIGLLASLPIMLLVGVIVKLDSRGPIIYSQTRVGRMGHLFEVLKFRSMRVDAESGTGAQWASENDPRVTRVGRFLRKYRIDELPQFINVIRGDMSFVGPRPERPCFVKELREKIPYYDERHSVRPGLTGWAQVQYSYGSNTEDAFNKLEYDLFYLKNMSLIFDLAIIFRTIRIVIVGQGGR